MPAAATLFLLVAATLIAPLCKGQTIDLRVNAVPVGAVGVAVAVDGPGIDTLFVVYEAVSGGDSWRKQISLRAGGPFRVRAAAIRPENGQAILLAGGVSRSGVLSSGTLVDISISLVPIAVRQTSPPGTVFHSARFEAAAAVFDAGELLDGARASLEWASAPGQIASGLWIRGPAGEAGVRVSGAAPLVGQTVSWRLTTFLFHVPGLGLPLYFYAPGPSASQTWVTALATETPVRVAVGDLPGEASGVAVFVDSAHGPAAVSAARRVAGTEWIDFDIGLVAGNGPYRVRAAGFREQEGVLSVLAGAQEAAELSPGQPHVVEMRLTALHPVLSASVPASAAVGDPIPLALECSDARGLLMGKSADWLTGSDGASGTGFLGTRMWLPAVEGDYTPPLLAPAAAVRADRFEVRATPPLAAIPGFGYLYLFAPSLDRFGPPWTVSLDPTCRYQIDPPLSAHGSQAGDGY